MVKQPRWNAITNPKAYSNRLTENERIEFIRKYGSEVQKNGMKSLLKYPHRDNCYTMREERMDMWKDKLDKGRTMVQTIIEKRIGGHIGCDDVI